MCGSCAGGRDEEWGREQGEETLLPVRGAPKACGGDGRSGEQALWRRGLGGDGRSGASRGVWGETGGLLGGDGRSGASRRVWGESGGLGGVGWSGGRRKVWGESEGLGGDGRSGGRREVWGESGGLGGVGWSGGRREVWGESGGLGRVGGSGVRREVWGEQALWRRWEACDWGAPSEGTSLVAETGGHWGVVERGAEDCSMERGVGGGGREGQWRRERRDAPVSQQHKGNTKNTRHSPTSRKSCAGSLKKILNFLHPPPEAAAGDETSPSIKAELKVWLDKKKNSVSSGSLSDHSYNFEDEEEEDLVK